MQLTLAEKHAETADVTSFFFTPAQPATWQAGQYTHIQLSLTEPDPEGDNRYFTISAAPFEGRIRITTRLTGTPFKKALDALPIGASLEAAEPEGDFVLPNPQGDYLFVAGGIGITPIRSILAQLAHERKPVTGKLLYGTRGEAAVFQDELAKLSTFHRLEIEYVRSPRHIDAELILANVADPATAQVYFSGPEPMVEALEKELIEKGMREDRLVRDYFPGYEESTY